MVPTQKSQPELKVGFFKVIQIATLRKQIDRARLLDRVVDFAMKLCGNTRHTTWKDLACLRGELSEKLGVGSNDQICRDIMPTTRHHTVRLTEVDTALNCFWLGHGKLEC
jgi:hypothetical protein